MQVGQQFRLPDLNIPSQVGPTSQRDDVKLKAASAELMEDVIEYNGVGGVGGRKQAEVIRSANPAGRR